MVVVTLTRTLTPTLTVREVGVQEFLIRRVVFNN